MNSAEFNHSFPCLYFSCVDRSVYSALHISLYVSAAAVILLTMCGNLLVIISISHFKQLHTPTNMLVLSLAVTDFLIGAFIMPPFFVWTIKSCWIFGASLCACFGFLSTVLVIISIYQIALIAVDRYFALSSPFLYMNKVSVSKMCAVISLNWFVLPWYSFALMYCNGHFYTVTACPRECIYFMNKVWSIINLVIMFIFPCSVIIILYIRVFMIVIKHANAIRELSNLTQAKTHTDSMKSERKAAKVLGIVVSVFMFSLLPCFIYSLLGGVIEQTSELLHVLTIVLYINSTINPFIYALFYPWFRRCVKIIITLQIFQPDSALMNVQS